MEVLEDVCVWYLNKFKNDKIEEINKVRLLKFVFLTDIWHSILHNEGFLFKEDYEAWSKGPAIPEVFFKYYNISKKVVLSSKILYTLNEVYSTYSQFDNETLELLICQDVFFKEARSNLAYEEKSQTLIDKSKAEKTFRKKYNISL